MTPALFPLLHPTLHSGTKPTLFLIIIIIIIIVNIIVIVTIQHNHYCCQCHHIHQYHHCYHYRYHPHCIFSRLDHFSKCFCIWYVWWDFHCEMRGNQQMSPQCRPPSLIDPKWWEKGGKSQLPCFATDLPLFKGFSWQSWIKIFQLFCGRRFCLFGNCWRF